MRDEVAALARSITPADRIEQIAHRVDDLTAEREAQQALAARLDEIESRLTADVVTPEDLARALAGAREDLDPCSRPARRPARRRARRASSPRCATTRRPTPGRPSRRGPHGGARPARRDAAPDASSLGHETRSEVAGDRGATPRSPPARDRERRLPAEIASSEELATPFASARTDLALTAPRIAPRPGSRSWPRLDAADDTRLERPSRQARAAADPRLRRELAATTVDDRSASSSHGWSARRSPTRWSRASSTRCRRGSASSTTASTRTWRRAPR